MFSILTPIPVRKKEKKICRNRCITESENTLQVTNESRNSSCQIAKEHQKREENIGVIIKSKLRKFQNYI